MTHNNKMKTFFALLLLCHCSCAVKHSLEYFLTTSYGLPDFPEFVAIVKVDGVEIGYCDSQIKTAKSKYDWTRELIRDNPDHLEWYSERCLRHQYSFRGYIENIMQRLNESGGVHILQKMSGCEWDDETGETAGFNQYGYDGEDFIAMDMETLTWIAPNPKAFMTKARWDAEKARLQHNKNHFIYMCPSLLKKYLQYGSSSLQRRVRPSVSLLQKSPSSLVSCFATGFYPDRAVMFWRKDGEELHEGVDHGEILPNHDETFQMSVELDVSSVKPEDRRRYECVFQLSGVKGDIVTRLDKLVIRSNDPPFEFPVALVAGVASALLFVSVCIAGLCLAIKKNNGFLPANRV
ncbi:major histocompatibility complex class I-related gene protein-like [Cheilinus undulatus]|uniref:major histocompatibility complex class I-related gene protein-like n=1 Tax=Cheilinus undulatus TaxID=241271 RepID=UPI001BD65C4D|nr:major histocompatibility complex class I-related gene protein-like [Cheilinus undulatus]